MCHVKTRGVQYFLFVSFFRVFQPTRFKAEIEETDELALQEEPAIVAEIESRIVVHHLPIMALSSGRTSLQDKFCCLMFALMLEAGTTRDSLASFTAEVLAGTFDLGVEFSLGRIQPTTFSDLFPWYHELGSDGGVGEEVPHDDFDVLQFQPELGAPEPVISLQPMLSVPGPLHILHNATNSLLENVPFLNAGVDKLQVVCRFLCNPDKKQRLLASCFAGPVAKSFHLDIKRFDAKVHTGRWGTVAFAIPKLLELRVPLQKFWNFDAFKQSGLPNNSADDASLKMEVVHECIESAEFWAQLVTLDHLFYVVRELLMWVESCPCHYKRQPPEGCKNKWDNCPLRGRRLPEIACGAFFEELNKICLFSAADLFLKLPDSLSEECRTQCVLDFEHGRGHLVFQMTLKMSCFLEPPLLLFGICHYNPEGPEKQKDVLRTCLRSDCQHPQILKLTQPGSLRQEAELFIAGEELAVLDDLVEYMSQFCFAWGTERRVEGGHAKVHITTGNRRNRHEATDSLALRLGEIKKVLSSDDVTSFLECVQAARTPKNLLAQLGLARHPSCRLAKSSWDPIYRKALYHADPFALYGDSLPPLTSSPQSVVRPIARLALPPIEPGDRDLAPEVEDMRRAAALRYLRARLEQVCMNKDKRCIFSCDLPSAAIRLLPHLLAPSQVDLEKCAGSAEECTDLVPSVSAADLIVAEVSHMSRVFFQVVALHPSRAKLAMSADFTPEDIGVMLLKCDLEGEDAYRVQTTGFNLQSPVAGTCGLQAQPLLLSLSSLSLSQLCSCVVWEQPASLDADSGSETTSFLATKPELLLPVRENLKREEAFVYEMLEQLHNNDWTGAIARVPEQRTRVGHVHVEPHKSQILPPFVFKLAT